MSGVAKTVQTDSKTALSQANELEPFTPLDSNETRRDTERRRAR